MLIGKWYKQIVLEYDITVHIDPINSWQIWLVNIYRENIGLDHNRD